MSNPLEDLKELEKILQDELDGERAPDLPQEVWDLLGESKISMGGHFTHFTLCCALYWYCCNYHGGQRSTEYRILSWLGYKPGATERGPEKESPDEEIYRMLETKKITPLQIVQAVVDYRKERETSEETE